MLRDRSFVPALAVSLALTSPALGQWVGPGGAHPAQDSHPIDQAGSGTLTRSCAGDFDGDGWGDAALLSDSKVQIVHKAGALPLWIDTSDVVNDLAARPRGAAAIRDQFITVGAGGAVSYWLNGTTVMSWTIEGTVWADAVLVESALHDNGTAVEEHIVGVLDGALTLEVLTRSSSAWVTSPIVLSPVAPKPIVELALADLDNDQEIDIAIACQDAAGTVIVIYELDGSLRQTYTYNGRTVTGLTSGRQGSGAGFFAWTTENLSGQEYLNACDATGISIGLSLGTPGVVGASTALWTDDNRSDVVLSLADEDELWVLTNFGARPKFSMNDYTAIPLVLGEFSSSSSNAGEPAATDIDLDGDVDLFVPVQEDAVLSAYRNPTNDHLEALPVISSEEDFGSVQVTLDTQCWQPNAPLHVSLFSDGGFGTATDVTIAVWRRNSLDAGVYTNPQAYLVETHELPPPGQTLQLDFYLQSPNAGQGCGSSVYARTTKLYYFELTFEENGVEFNPVWYGIETEPSGTDNYDHLVEEQATGTALEWPAVYVAEESPPGSDPETIGSVHRLRRVPGIEPGYQPQK